MAPWNGPNNLQWRFYGGMGQAPQHLDWLPGWPPKSRQDGRFPVIVAWYDRPLCCTAASTHLSISSSNKILRNDNELALIMGRAPGSKFAIVLSTIA